MEEGKANVNVKDNNGKSALSHGRGHFKMVKYLVEAGADTSALSGSGIRCYPYKCRQFVANFHAQCKLMFLLGFHKSLGVDSSILLFLDGSSIFEPALLPCIFEFYPVTIV